MYALFTVALALTVTLKFVVPPIEFDGTTTLNASPALKVSFLFPFASTTLAPLFTVTVYFPAPVILGVIASDTKLLPSLESAMFVLLTLTFNVTFTLSFAFLASSTNFLINGLMLYGSAPVDVSLSSN